MYRVEVSDDNALAIMRAEHGQLDVVGPGRVAKKEVEGSKMIKKSMTLTLGSNTERSAKSEAAGVNQWSRRVSQATSLGVEVINLADMAKEQPVGTRSWQGGRQETALLLEAGGVWTGC